MIPPLNLADGQIIRMTYDGNYNARATFLVTISLGQRFSKDRNGYS